MIILDTSILRSFGPESSSADLLRAIRAIGAQRVGVPWMVMEELAAQQAIKYQEKFEAAAQAVEALRQATPWGLEVPIGLCETDSIREHWRDRWSEVVETIPTSNEALREAAFREANCLPPCKTSKGAKTGSRDAAIWLSAVEYARQHPEETVYFASANTKDFGDGTVYPSPMCDDIAGLEVRFVHWTDLDEVVTHFTEPTATDLDRVVGILNSPDVLKQVPPAVQAGGYLPVDGSFACNAVVGISENAIIPALGWVASHATVGAIESAQMYRIGDQEWCTAIVRWHLSGVVVSDQVGGATASGCGLTASVLFTPNPEDSRLTVLRAELPQPLSNDAFNNLALPHVEWTRADTAVAELTSRATQVPFTLHPYRRGRTYEGASVRRVSTLDVVVRDVPPAD
ncbi:DUF4935 domain-containing protein [Streptomyces ferrugineus]|uniref:DUF4935 domain-containing protein n=1 Tax=Streptomyces ferrugineus TaxID=1413221 RepID=A0A7M2SVB8_9ACTN|nr:PIN domain-containing protein [Streptomyces ferrugineus]QOV40194.1 DUF4935 domain-containing protein [Streptomyces ferrugineus]